MPKISIITTTYRHEKFITDTIESILDQSLIDWELLIWDDSPDTATWDIIEKYTQKYPDKIKAWHHNPNKWIVDNTNFLLSQIHQKSEFVAFLEWDDRYTPDNFVKKIEIFEKYREVQLVYSDLSFIDSKNTIILPSFFEYRDVPLFQNTSISVDEFILLPAGPIASWSTSMVRREMIEQYPLVARWDDKKYSIADYDFYFQVATNYPVYGIDEQLTQYRRHGGNLSGANGWTSYDLERYIDIIFTEWKIDKEAYHAKKSWLSITFAVFAVEHGDKKNAWIHLQNALASRFFYMIHYKIAILWFLCIPISVGQYILKKLIKRGN